MEFITSDLSCIFEVVLSVIALSDFDSSADYHSLYGEFIVQVIAVDFKWL